MVPPLNEHEQPVEDVAEQERLEELLADPDAPVENYRIIDKSIPKGFVWKSMLDKR